MFKYLTLLFLSFLLLGCTVKTPQDLNLSTDAKPTQQESVKLPKSIKTTRWQKFRICQDNSECIIATDVCNRPVAINKTYQDEFFKAVEKRSQVTRCRNISDFDKSKLSTSCEPRVCTLHGFDE